MDTPEIAQHQPYEVTGFYDEGGCFHPGFYDDAGDYHEGYGWFDEDGAWRVQQGHYTPTGEWVPTSAGAPGIYDEFFCAPTGEVLEAVYLWRDQVLSAREFVPRADGDSLTIGGDVDADFVVGEPVDGTKIIRFQQGEYILTVPKGAALLLHEEGATHPISSLAEAHEVILSPGIGAEVRVGDFRVLFRFSDHLALRAGVAALDREPIPFIGASAITHVLALLLAMAVPDTAGALDLDGYDAQDRFVQVALTENQTVEESSPGWENDELAAPEAAKHAGEEGEAGDPDEAPSNNRLAVRGPAENEDIELARARDREIAANAGIATQLTSAFAFADKSIGADAVHALGKVDGSNVGPARGIFGLGVRGEHPGGGGWHHGSVGIGDIDTGRLTGVSRGCRGVKCGEGDGADLGKSTEKVPKAVLVAGKPKLTGSLDREIIRRVVRQNRRQIKACYETELQKNKHLAGEVVVKFTITGDGSVIAATVKPGGSLENAAVESCLTSRIRRWVFPRQDGNDGIVIVSYPFRFFKS